ncbi:MAG: iron permease, partial [Candidatus Dadabacteria bacterium]|nr:iron permease [Candidatus Dadabacteria bacterium]
IAKIRTNTGLLSDSTAGENEPLLLAGSLLQESIVLYEKGDKKLAYSKAIDAYLEGFEKVENKLAVKDKKLTLDIENMFGEFRGQIKNDESTQAVKATYEQLNTGLANASILLTDTKPLGKAFSFLQSFAIIVREGLEAVLIVAAIIAFLTSTGSRKAVKYVHYGWISALAAGIATWVIAQTVISITSTQREIIEGVTSLIAAAVLFYVSYWFITKIEVQKWKEFIEGKVKQALTKKNVITLASVSFFAVYREAFETVLFYQALWLQAENTQTEVIWGFLIGSAFMIALFIVIFKLGLRMPLRHFFGISSGLLYLLSFVLVGKGIREFQEAGIIGITPVQFVPNIDILGIYPTLQTTAPQAVLLFAFIFAIVWIFVIKQERERKEIVVSVSKIA